MSFIHSVQEMVIQKTMVIGCDVVCFFQLYVFLCVILDNKRPSLEMFCLFKVWMCSLYKTSATWFITEAATVRCEGVHQPFNQPVTSKKSLVLPDKQHLTNKCTKNFFFWSYDTWHTVFMLPKITYSSHTTANRLRFYCKTPLNWSL